MTDRIDLAIIGGTGFEQADVLEGPKAIAMDTEYGVPAHPVLCGEFGGLRVGVLNRHGDQDKYPPHRVNYRANIQALHELGARMLISVTAVGGIRDDLQAGALVSADQIIDYTHGREHTYFTGGAAGLEHIEFGEPFDADLRRKLLAAGSSRGLSIADGGVYGVSNGPRLETAAEVSKMQRDGCDMVGMTLMPEVGLARERGMRCVNCAVIANRGAGLEDEPISIAEIGRILSLTMNDVRGVLREFAGLLREAGD